MRKTRLLSLSVSAGAALLAASGIGVALLSAQPSGGQKADPRGFVAGVNEEIRKLAVRSSTAEWIKNTYITDDTERMAAAANEELLGYMSRAVKQAAEFQAVPADADTERMLHLLRVSSPLAAPADAKLRLELTTLAAKMEGLYGKAKACGADGKSAKCLRPRGSCRCCSRRAATRPSCATPGWAGTAPRAASRPLYTPLRRAGQRGRPGDRLRRRRPDVALGLRHDAGRLREGDRAAVAAGQAALRGPALLRARPARRRPTARTRSPPTGPVPAHLLGQHVGAGVGQHLPAGRALQGAGQPGRAARRWPGRSGTPSAW